MKLERCDDNRILLKTLALTEAPRPSLAIDPATADGRAAVEGLSARRRTAGTSPWSRPPHSHAEGCVDGV